MSRISILVRKPWRALGALGLLVASIALALGTGADFTASSANPSNTFSAGSLTMDNSNDGAAILTASGMKPGDSTNGTVDIKNTGSIGGDFTVSSQATANSDATNPLSSELDLLIEDCGLFSGDTPPDCTSPTQVYSGKLDAASDAPLGSFAADDKHRYRFTVTLPSAAGDVYQNASTTAEFDWAATQS